MELSFEQMLNLAEKMQNNNTEDALTDAERLLLIEDLEGQLDKVIEKVDEMPEGASF